MSTKRIAWIFTCSLLVFIYMVSQPNFGFVPLNGAVSFGQDIVPTLIYIEIVWATITFIKVIKKNKENNEV